MKGSIKFFIASIIVLAAATGFFVGSVCNKPCPFKGSTSFEGKMPPPPHGMNGPGFPPPGMNGPGMPPPGARGPHGDFNEQEPQNNFAKGPTPAMMDSILQVTPEQKEALEKNRIVMDSTIKAMRKQKLEAEHELGKALDSGDEAAINSAKEKVLAADKALLEHRIAGVSDLAKILSKEQMEKFREFHKERMDQVKGKHFKHKGKPKFPPQN